MFLRLSLCLYLGLLVNLSSQTSCGFKDGFQDMLEVRNSFERKTKLYYSLLFSLRFNTMKLWDAEEVN